MSKPTPTSTLTTTSPTESTPSPHSQTTDADTSPVSEQVIAVIAAVTDTDPTEMEPLYRFLDPDSLDQLFGSSDTDVAVDGRVTFSFAGCEVVVRNDETVAVTPQWASEPAWDTATDAVPPLPSTASPN